MTGCSMRRRRREIGILWRSLLLLIGTCLVVGSKAYVQRLDTGVKTQTDHCLLRRTTRPHPSPSATAVLSSTIALASSTSDNDLPPGGSDEDDEISKLIGKRSQIKRKKKEELEPEDISVEPLEEIDLDKLPQFKTERPVRRARSSDEEEQGTEEEQAKKQDSPIVDYKADYDDENDLHIPNRIGVSTAAWGDPKRNFVASGKLTKRMIKSGKFVPGDVQLAFNELLEGGILFVETSSTYGAANRKNELSAQDILQRCLQEHSEDLPESMLMESLAGPAWLKAVSSSRVEQELVASCERMGLASVEILQIPKSFLFPSFLLSRAMVAALDSGWANHVGVQGLRNAGSLRRICRALDKKGYSLTSASFVYSLTNQKYEALMDACRDNNVIPLITDPLDNGLASGTITASNPSGGQVSSSGAAPFSFKVLEKLQPLHSVQETLAERVRTRVIRELRDIQDRYKSRYGPPPSINTDITTTQIALNYIIAKGGVPLVEVNTPNQAKEVLGSLGWTLTDEEVNMLDAAVALCRL